jgi:hypothetical protein
MPTFRFVNQGVSGSALCENARHIGGNTAYKTAVGSPGVYVNFVGALNNLQHPDATHTVDAARHSLRAWIAHAICGTLTEQTAYTFGGTWTGTDTAGTFASGGSLANTSTNAAYFETAVTPGTYWFWGYGFVTAGFVNAGTLTFALDGTTITTTDYYDQHIDTNGFSTDHCSPLATKLVIGSSGTLRGTFSTNGRSPAYIYGDALLKESTSQPKVIYVQPLLTTNAPYNKPTLRANLITMGSEVCAEFGSNVNCVDISSGWNTSTMLGADGLHPNNTGMAYIATQMQTVFTSIGT